MTSFTRAVPKPTKARNSTEAVIKIRAEQSQLMTIINALQGIGLVVCEKRSPRGDGLVDQTIHISGLAPAKHYEPRPERTRPEYPGYVYLVLGLKTGRLKVGETDDMQRRLGELRREFGETFKRLHIIHTRDRFAKEKEIQGKLTEWGLHLEREFFNVPESIEQWFISQPNEF